MIVCNQTYCKGCGSEVRRSNKDILQGYIQTLSDEDCKEIYYYITGYKESSGKYLEFDRVKLTQGQYDKLIFLWGKDKTDCCIDILNNWLIKKGDKVKPYLSHYKSIMGWVESVYYRSHPIEKVERFNSSIDTTWKARKYINSIPKELRSDDSEVKFLVERFGIDIL